MPTIRLIFFHTKLDIVVQDRLTNDFLGVLENFKKFGGDYEFLIGDFRLKCSANLGDADKISLKQELVKLDNPVEHVVSQIIHALGEQGIDAVWFYNGGILAEGTGLYEKMMEKMFVQLEEVFSKLSRPSPVEHNKRKLFVGYCYPTPIMCYLAAKGVARAFHGPLGRDCRWSNTVDEQKIADQTFEVYKKIFTHQEIRTLDVAGIELRNKAAEGFNSGGGKITGIIIGGLLKIVHDTVKHVLVQKNVLYDFIAKKEPIILFLEFIATGGAFNIGELLGYLGDFKLWLGRQQLPDEQKLNVQAIFIGNVVLPNPVPPEILKEYERKIGELAALDIPVFSGLNIGHCLDFKQLIVPIERAEVKMNDKNLHITYLDSAAAPNKSVLLGQQPQDFTGRLAEASSSGAPAPSATQVLVAQQPYTSEGRTQLGGLEQNSLFANRRASRDSELSTPDAQTSVATVAAHPSGSASS